MQPIFGSGPRGYLAVVTAATTALIAAGCSYQEAQCRDGEYPAAQVRGLGRYCVPDRQNPDPGFVRYPAGKAPQYVGDKWDVYWSTHQLDENGNEVTGTPEPSSS